jgi:hypothetical protein
MVGVVQASPTAMAVPIRSAQEPSAGAVQRSWERTSPFEGELIASHCASNAASNRARSATGLLGKHMDAQGAQLTSILSVVFQRLQGAKKLPENSICVPLALQSILPLHLPSIQFLLSLILSLLLSLLLPLLLLIFHLNLWVMASPLKKEKEFREPSMRNC